MFKLLSPLVAVSCLFLASCDRESARQEPQRESVPKRTPLDDLKFHLAHAMSDDKAYPNGWSGLHYDVTTTNSLVTPYEGIIETTLCPNADKPKEIVMYRAKLAYREGQWTLAELQASNGWGLQTVEPNDSLGYFNAFARHHGF
jgi:hypothetical protein